MPADQFSSTPEPPYYAVIFTAQRSRGDHGYTKMSEHIASLAKVQPGYLGFESVEDSKGFEITVSYWDSEESIRAWKAHIEHQAAQERGRQAWYEHYEIRVARVERAYNMLTSKLDFLRRPKP